MEGGKTMKIAGYDVPFPFKPYPTQIALMQKILLALKRSQNCLLESPTGTGKSMTLLCASLAWLSSFKKAVECKEDVSESEDDEVELTLENAKKIAVRKRKQVKLPKIFYATRTHSQVGQVVRELKNTSFTPKMSVLGSRDQYCIHKKVSLSKDKAEECRDLVTKNRCEFKNSVFKSASSTDFDTFGHLRVWDIEDLVTKGRESRSCPYFLSRVLAEDADITFCPYNYIIDAGIRESMGIDLTGSVVIFDEAHNIEDVCREAGSCDVHLDDLKDSVAELGFLSEGEFDLVELYQELWECFSKLSSWIETVRNDIGGNNNNPRVWHSEDVKRLLNDWGFTEGSFQSKQDALEVRSQQILLKTWIDIPNEKEISKLSEDQYFEGQIMSKASIFPLKTVLDSLQYVFRKSENVKTYKFTLYKAPATHPRGGFVFGIWTMQPAAVFREISEKARSVIVSSGTLSPLTSFSTELGASFDVTMEAPHVIDVQKQVFSCAIRQHDATALNGTFQFVNTDAFKNAIGESIIKLSSRIPDGVLVFFPSYALLDKCLYSWKATNILRRLKSIKNVVVEPRSSDDMDSRMKKYYQSIDKPQGRRTGAVFLAVCRGKVSEGLDFADKRARGVIVVGLPFPNTKDLNVNLKKNFNNALRSGGDSAVLSGDQWYSLQAFRALNQAIGRCIRHIHDYGAIIFLDQRYTEPRSLNSVSKWLRGRVASIPQLDSCLAPLTQFFQGHSQTEGPRQQQAEPESKSAAKRSKTLDRYLVAKMDSPTKSQAQTQHSGEGVDALGGRVDTVEQVCAHGNSSRFTKRPPDVQQSLSPIRCSVVDRQDLAESPDIATLRYELKCVSCDFVLVSREDERFEVSPTTRQTLGQLLGESVYALAETETSFVPGPLMDDSKRLHAKGLWVPEDGFVYGGVYCPKCPRDKMLGVLIEAARKEFVQCAGELWIGCSNVEQQSQATHRPQSPRPVANKRKSEGDASFPSKRVSSNSENDVSTLDRDCGGAGKEARDQPSAKMSDQMPSQQHAFYDIDSDDDFTETSRRKPLAESGLNVIRKAPWKLKLRG